MTEGDVAVGMIGGEGEKFFNGGFLDVVATEETQPKGQAPPPPIEETIVTTESLIDTTDTEMALASTPETPIQPIIKAPNLTIDTEESVADLEIVDADTLTAGKLIEVWCGPRSSGKWLLATYVAVISRTVLSQLTQNLDNGHQVTFHHDPGLPGQVATADIRLVST